MPTRPAIERPLLAGHSMGATVITLASAKSQGLTLACSPRREAALFMCGLSYNPWPLLDKINSPTLVLEGEASENRTYIDLKKAASLMQNGTHKLVKDAGHLIPMEKPAETADIIKEFFDMRFN